MIARVRPFAPVRHGEAPAWLLIAGVMAAVALRVAVGGSRVASSYPAAIVFTAALALTAWSAGRPRGRPAPKGVLVGAAGAFVLVAFSVVRVGTLAVMHLSPWVLIPWLAVVLPVATAEEVLLRGLLFDAISARHGQVSAVVAAAVVFALIHVPLYGMSVIPLDLAVGVLLGGLRIGGGLSASITAHCLADVLGGVLL